MGMRAKILVIVGVGLAMTAMLGNGCKKARPSVKIDPHSPEATIQQILLQGGLLNDAVKRKDFQYIHDNMYYLQSLAKALDAKLEVEQKERLHGLLDELAKVTNELDHSAGRRHEEATQAGMQKLQEVLRELETQFRAEKRNRAARSVEMGKSSRTALA
ncbi:MAG: hypothetical protein DME26_06280 [Verrucomicrobia bacterium]|nr:MAG: hypothetical protein DME26_06280 [Verrucomicrobiota bacterium]